MDRLPGLLPDRELLAPSWRHRSSHRRRMHRLLWALPALVVTSLVIFFFAVSGGRLSPTASWSTSLRLLQEPRPTASTTDPARRISPYSFDLAALASSSPRTADWMAAAPDDWSLARLALPGTHDTMTHRLGEPGADPTTPGGGYDIATVFRCQNTPLAVQLAAGVRYLDIRARVQVQPEEEEEKEATPPLGIYHADVYTGYDFAAVAQTVFAFLAAHPSEAVVLRLKEEGAPVRASAADPPGRWHGGDARRVEGPAGTAPFLSAFDHYRLRDPRTAPGFARHLYVDSGVGTDTPGIPPLGALRGKVLLLQEFPYYARGGGRADPGNSTAFRPRHGVPWRLASARLRVEDDWQIADLAHLDGKWAAVEASLTAAAAAAEASSSSSSPLSLSHLSASVGVTPIDAAAGPPNGSVVGINDRAGPWLVADDHHHRRPRRSRKQLRPVGIVIADFPGQRLVEGILRRNSFVSW